MRVPSQYRELTAMSSSIVGESEGRPGSSSGKLPRKILQPRRERPTSCVQQTAKTHISKPAWE